MLKVTFDNSDSPFFKTLKNKVDHYFSSKHLDPSGNKALFLKGIIMVVSAVLIYGTLVFFTPPIWLAVILCGLFGLNLAAIGFNIMHEGGHQSFSKYPWLNKISAYSLNALGGTSYFWKIKHNINHHTYTNIEGMDSDIDVKPFMRLHESQPRYWFHRFQHLYWVILYGLSYIAWVFWDDFKKYVSGKISPNSDVKRIALKEHFIFWATKVSYIGVYIILPVIMVGWVHALVGLLIAMFVCGLAISIVFQLAHVVEGTKFTVAEQDQANRIEQEWAVHQLTTTANFGTHNKVISWLLGGLNFQIEHHLFPRISHVHYPIISQLVRETCEEYNIKYMEYSSMLKAIHSHLFHIRRLGVA
jgi:linoleoyl-CoA desaturase